MIRLNQNCTPRSLRAIENIPEDHLHHFDYEQRHPLGIYKNALSELNQLFDESFHTLSNLHSEYLDGANTSGFDLALDAHKNLIYRLREFIDDCYLVLQTLTPVNDQLYPKVIFTNQYLEKVKFPGFKSFESKISYYKNDHLGPIVNALKHKHRKLKGIYFHKNDEQLFVPGYYVEGASKRGMLAPCRKVHHDENSAFSFNRDIKLHVWNLFLIDDALCHAINAAKDFWGINVNNSEEGHECCDLSNIIEKASMLPHLFYPDEQLKPTVHIEKTDNGYELNYPHKKGIENLPANTRVATLPTVDMSTPAIKLPYFSLNRN